MKKVCMFLMEALCALALPICIVFVSCAQQALQPSFLAEGQEFPFTKITMVEEYPADAEEYANHMTKIISRIDERFHPDALNPKIAALDSTFQLWRVEAGRETSGGEHCYGVQFTALVWVSEGHYALCELVSPQLTPLEESLVFEKDDFVLSADSILYTPAYKSQNIAVGLSVIAYEEGLGVEKTYYYIDESIRLYCPF